MPTTTSAEHVYVYAAIEGAARALPRTGMPEGDAPRALDVSHEVWLAVSTVPSTTYSAPALEPRLSDLDWVSHAGAAHHAIVDTLADSGAAVLPFRLFTIFSSEAQAIAAVRDRLPAMRRAFERVRGRQEWVLRIGKPDPARRERTSAAPATSGTTFLAAKAAERREDSDRARRTAEDATASYHALARLALEATTRPIDPRGHLLLDAAFLIRPDQVDALKDTLSTHATQLLRDGCPVSLTGPWPPYSFASVDTHG